MHGARSATGRTTRSATRVWGTAHQRVAFGNGVFVVGGQAGLLAVTKDGKTWTNNTTDPNRGDVQCVEFTRIDFLATTTKGTLRSADGKTWTEAKSPPARQVRRVGEWLYTSTYAPSKLARSGEGGNTWEVLPNAGGWHFKAFARGPLAGGPPPEGTDCTRRPQAAREMNRSPRRVLHQTDRELRGWEWRTRIQRR